MSIFLITFISIYGGMHAYAFFRMRSLYTPGNATTAVLASWMVLMTIAPLLVRFFERSGMDRIALLIAWPGYIWMGFLFLLVTALLPMETICAINLVSKRTYSFAAEGILSAASTFRLALLIALVASIYAIFEANRIRSDHVTISTSKLPAGVSRIRIVQVSDIHLGLLLREKRLGRIIKTIREAQPDILVSTGDMVDGRLSREEILPHQRTLAAMLSAVPAPAGKFAVVGNHEVFAGLRQAIEFTRSAGFIVLRGQSVALPNGITITGIDDPVVGKSDRVGQRTEKALLESLPAGSFHLLLKHRPFIPPGSDGRFDLQLSGHVHKGQLFPFNFLVELTHPFPCGTSTTAAGSQLHVSRGTGTWGPPMRLFAPPEVTVIDILPSNGH
ncbi:MAG: metallophosphoesterase [Pseudomonadota bacterium]